MRWQIHHDCTNNSPQNIIAAILQNRGLVTQEAVQHHLFPQPPGSYLPPEIGIDGLKLDQAVKLIKSAIQSHQPILIYGDYDADGITATAILWETLHHLGANAVPFIPSRENHGYGLSIAGLKQALSLIPNQSGPSIPLIITVDNGIVAHEPTAWLKQQNIPLIITDHHQPNDKLPEAEVIVHTQMISGAGISWFLSRQLSPEFSASTLDLVAIGTIADMMPLVGVNRSLAKYGLAALSQTVRPGIKSLLTSAAISLFEPITPYHINYVIAPRLNAMGRLEHALDSLRLLCTRNQARADSLATKLDHTNRLRQDLTTELLNFANGSINSLSLDPVIVVSHTNFHEGVIGLIAGKLAENYYRPAIVISEKAQISKASARSIKGVNITELIRSQRQLLVGVGGHPMAAGFSIETANIATFKQAIIDYAHQTIPNAAFEPSLNIDCQISTADITPDLFRELQTLEPFGIGNPQPVFALNQVVVNRVQAVGKQAEHKKILIDRANQPPLTCLWFRSTDQADKIKPGDKINLAGTIGQNTWNGRTELQLVLKDAVIT